MMKKFFLAAGSKLKRIAQAGKRKCGKLLGRSASAGDGKVVAPVEGSEGVGTGPQKAAGAIAQEPAAAAEGRKYRAPAKPKIKEEWSLDSFPVVPEEGKSRFHDYSIPLPVMRAVAEQNFQYCTAIQAKALEDVLAGHDLIGKANTGTGKTAVFLIAILSRLLADTSRGAHKGGVRALVLAPTRELVMQIAKDGAGLAKYSGINVCPVFGGVDYQKQLGLLQNKKCDVVVATPGRLLDFIGKNAIDLRDCRTLVLDEADRMLDMGFIPDVRRIIGRLPAREERQTLLFSATVPEDVQRLASQWCVKPKVVEAEPEQVAVETVEQTIYLTTAEEKYAVLYNLIIDHPDDRIMVFANMKNETKRLANRLERNGIDCLLLSGDVEQAKRASRLEMFRSGKVKVLVATDVAGRGIHIEGITFVVNYTLPYEPEDYVHRIGRTGRAGASGKAVSFACEEGSFYLPAIEEFINRKFECVLPEERLLAPPPKGQSRPSSGNTSAAAPAPRDQQRSGKRRRPGGQGRGPRRGAKVSS
ncbi:MAG: DEAD/DEAH box helicase [Desulforhopalus sp.]|nr:DEAD/DEAH box helicase [Desulforhopalus sp.]